MLIQYPAGWDLPTGAFEHVVGFQDVMPAVLEAAGIAPPPGLTGASMLQAVRGRPWREFLHGEHSPCYAAQEAMHYLPDARQKYIYFPATGEEQLFDLTADRAERTNLAGRPQWDERRRLWRRRLVELLARRGDGFVRDGDLAVRPEGWSAVVEPDPSGPAGGA